MLLDDCKPLCEDRHPFFGPDENSWNLDAELGSNDYGKPGVGVVAGAIAVWAGLQPGDVTIGSAATAFCMPPEAVAQCVEWHPYTYYVGDETTPLEQLVIQFEGE